MSSGIILDLITQFGSSSDKRLDWKKVTFSGEIVAGNYPVNEWSWELREWAETWYILKQEAHPGKRTTWWQKKSQMKEIKSRKNEKNITTGEVSAQGKKSSMPLV